VAPLYLRFCEGCAHGLGKRPLTIPALVFESQPCWGSSRPVAPHAIAPGVVFDLPQLGVVSVGEAMSRSETDVSYPAVRFRSLEFVGVLSGSYEHTEETRKPRTCVGNRRIHHGIHRLSSASPPLADPVPSCQRLAIETQKFLHVITRCVRLAFGTLSNRLVSETVRTSVPSIGCYRVYRTLPKTCAQHCHPSFCSCST
jgi:hypothetical protein